MLWSALSLGDFASIVPPTPVLEDLRNDVALLLADDLEPALADLDALSLGSGLGLVRDPRPVDVLDVLVGMWVLGRFVGDAVELLSASAPVERTGRRSGRSRPARGIAAPMIVADRLRAPSAVDLAAAAYKDWLHVNVFDFAHGRVGLVNVSLHGDPADPRSLAAGAVLLGDVEDGWVQRVEVIGAGEATAGHNEIAVGDVAAILLDDAGGGVGVHGRLPGDRGGFDLAAFPSATPVVAEAATPFGSGWIAWRAVPRMTVTGWVLGRWRGGPRRRDGCLPRPQLGTVVLGRRRGLGVG